MTNLIETLLVERQLTNRPPLFNGTNYTFWKIHMKIFIQAQDYDLWKIIIDSAHTPNALIEHDKKMAQLNAKTMNILYYSLDINKFNAIFSCILVK